MVLEELPFFEGGHWKHRVRRQKYSRCTFGQTSGSDNPTTRYTLSEERSSNYSLEESLKRKMVGEIEKYKARTYEGGADPDLEAEAFYGIYLGPLSYKLERKIRGERRKKLPFEEATGKELADLESEAEYLL